MSQTTMTQMMMNRLGTETSPLIPGAAADTSARSRQKDAFSSILTERMAGSSETSKRAVPAVSQTAARAQRSEKDVTTPVDVQKKEPMHSAKVDHPDKSPVMETKAVESASVKETVRVDETESVKAIESVKTIESVDAIEETAETADAATLSQIATLLEKLLTMLEEQFAALKQAVADGATPAIAELPQVATELVELLTKLGGELKGNTDVLALLKANAGDEMPENLRVLLEKLEASDIKLTLVTSSSPEKANGNDLVQLKLTTEGFQAKIRLLQKPQQESLDQTLEVGAETDTVLATATTVEAGKDTQSSSDDSAPQDRSSQTANESVQTVTVDKNVQMTMVTDNGPKLVTLKFEPTVQPTDATKPTLLTDVQKSAMTSQVVEKVKLMSGESKSELEMTLKPESLGKVNLKLIEERGQILARFTAESEQVKSVLESNMQLLKDALEKSGVSVGDVSVSVGQRQQGNEGNAGESKQQHERETARVNISEKLRRMPSMGSYNLSSRVVEYLNGIDSSINVTA